jgi:hypothetical protein
LWTFAQVRRAADQLVRRAPSLAAAAATIGSSRGILALAADA